MRKFCIIRTGLQLRPTSFEDPRRLMAWRMFESETDAKNKELEDGKVV
jgi:hypothetical protein